VRKEAEAAWVADVGPCADERAPLALFAPTPDPLSEIEWGGCSESPCIQTAREWRNLKNLRYRLTLNFRVMATSTTYLASTSLFVQHIGPPEAPECPARVERILSAFAEHQLITHPDLRIIEPRSASAEEIARVHARTHIERLEHLAAHPPSTFVFVNRSGDATKQAALADDSTYFSAKSWEAAKHASGAVCDVVERVIADMRAGRASSNGFTLGRPPGHHSEPDTAQGFCLVNNVAVGAAHAKHLLGPNGRVLILDWDVHHGNGTERMFYSDPSMLYISTHLFGDRRFYPYTGAMDRSALRR